MKKQIGLFGGSFDPVHIGHIKMALIAQTEASLDEVWFIPASKNPLKKKDPREQDKVRIELLTIALKNYPQFKVEPIELELPPPSYTIRTVESLQQRHPHVEFFLIIGSDQLSTLNQWAEINKLVKCIEFIILNREKNPAFPALDSLKYRLARNDLIEISSTQVRKAIANNTPLRGLLPATVITRIQEMNYYANC